MPSNHFEMQILCLCYTGLPHTWFCGLSPHVLFCTCIGSDGPKKDFWTAKIPFSLSMHWLRKWRSDVIICFTSVCFLLMWSRRFFLLSSIPQWIHLTLICFEPGRTWCLGDTDMCGSLGEGWGWSKGAVWADAEGRGVLPIRTMGVAVLCGDGIFCFFCLHFVRWMLNWAFRIIVAEQ